MAIPIEAYTGEGVLTGVITDPGRLRDVLETLDEVHLAPVRGLALDGRTLDSPGEVVATDALLLVVPDEADVPVHATWHDIHLTIGPYVVDGELPTMPGFDPGRALARPSGMFILLREVTVSLIADPGRVIAFHGRLLVNRYNVETIAAGLVLGFFFPGAAQELREPADVAPSRPAMAAVGSSPSADAGIDRTPDPA
jgi:hypothetical protein